MSKKWILSILITLIVLVGLSQVILQSPFFSERIVGIAATQLEKIVGQAVSIESASINLMTASIALESFVIASEQAGAPPLFSAETLRVYVSPGSIFTEIFLVRKIEIDAPNIQLSGDGSQKLPFLKKVKSKQGGGFASPVFIIREIRVSDGHLFYKGNGVLKELSLSGISSEIRPDLKMRQFEINLIASKGMVSTEEMTKEIDQFQGEMLVDPDKIEIMKAEMFSGPMSLNVKGDIRLKTEKPLDLHLDLKLPIESIASFGLDQAVTVFIKNQSVSGTLVFTGVLSGGIPDISLNGKLELPALRAVDQAIGSVEGVVSYHADKVGFSAVSGKIFSGSFSGDFEAEMLPLSQNNGKEKRQLAFKSNLKYEGIPIDQVLNVSPFRDRVKGLTLKGIFASGDVALAGPGKENDRVQVFGSLRVERRPLFSPPLEAESSSIQKLIALLKRGKLDWRWSPKGMVLQEAEFLLPETKVSIDGSWSNEKGLSLDARLSSQEVSQIATIFHTPLAGEMNVNGVFTHLDGISIFEGGVLVEKGQLRGQTFTSFASGLYLKGTQIRIKEAVLRVPAKRKEEIGKSGPPAGLYLAKGKLDLEDLKAPHFDFKVEIKAGNPQEVFQFLDLKVPLYSTVNGSITVRGVPESYFVKGPFELNAGSIYGEDFDQGWADLTVSEKEVLLENVVLTKGKGLLTGKGVIRYNHTYSLAIKGEDLRVQGTHLLRWMPPSLTARVGLVVSGEGSFEKPQFQFVAAIKDLHYSELSSVRGTIKADWHDKEISFEGDFPDKKISVKGDVQVAPFFPYTFSGSFDQFRIDPIVNEYLPGTIGEVVLQVSGKLSGSGEISKPALLTLSGDLSELRADFGEYQLQNDGPLAIQAKEGTFLFKNTRFKGENTALVLNGSLTIFQRWGIFLKGKADLNLITFFSKKIASGKGEAVLDLAVSDEWASPKFRGELKLQEGRIRTAHLSQLIKVSALSALFNERHVILENLQGKLGGGDFHATGKVVLDGFKAGDFGFLLELDQVRLDLAKDLPATVKGELFFQKKGLDQTLDGDLSVKHIYYEKKVNLKTVVADFLKKKGNTLSEETPIIGQTKINIHLYGKDDIWIANNLTKMPLEIDLILKGLFDHPQLLGNIDVPKGEIYFRNNTFRVTSGSVNFSKPEEIDPVFDLRARTTVRNVVTDRNYDIDLELSGTVSQINLRWNAFPALSEGDILALLAIGKTTADLVQVGGRSDTEATNFVVSEFLADPLEQVTGVVGKPVEDITGIDDIRVEPSIDDRNPDATIGTRLTAEKRLLEDRLIVIYQTTLDPSEEEVIRMVYEVNKHISLVGKQDEDGQVGGDIRFRFEFR